MNIHNWMDYFCETYYNDLEYYNQFKTLQEIINAFEMFSKYQMKWDGKKWGKIK